ncbi:AcaB family transcriptional regulator, partial [Staphylococcus aureus]
IMKMLKEATNTGLHVLAGAQAIGLNYSVLRSAEPKKLQLGFKSPYGFGMAEMVVTFDYFVRVWKTLEYRDLRSTEQV